MDATQLRYLQLLSHEFPTAISASVEIAKLESELSLPKSTVFFASDIHGEYEAFSHILRNASGNTRAKIKAIYDTVLSPEQQKELATLIYYPEQKMNSLLAKIEDQESWFSATVPLLLALCKDSARKHSISTVRLAIAKDLQEIVEELIARCDDSSRCQSIIMCAIRANIAQNLVIALCQLIQRLAIDHLHIVGDIYDRGPYPQYIMEDLMSFHSLDIQWGNHDIVWMGAALGQRGCIAHVVRNCARYGNLSILEDAYGINLRPLASFALKAYQDDPCVAFNLKGNPGLTPQELEVNIKIQKAMAILQFKVEAALIDEYPSFELNDRKLLHQINHEKGTICIDDVEYEIIDRVFPTVDLNDPYKLSEEEEEVMQGLEQAFLSCEKLQRHMAFFLEKGSLYKIDDGYLMFHACVPLNDDGSLREANIYGTKYKGRALYDIMQEYVYDAFYSTDEKRRKLGRDLLWYMWLGQGSPLFAKSKMATFELYLIAEKPARKEIKNAYYTLINDESVLESIFEDFGMDPKKSRIVCGHTPVKIKDGDDPIKCAGRAFIIDGGFSAAYQPTTGIAGLTLIDDENGIVLDSHKPLESTYAAINDNLDIQSDRRIVAAAEKPLLLEDSQRGKEIHAMIADLRSLVDAYQEGLISEQNHG